MKEKMEGEGVASPTGGGVIGEGMQQIVRPATLPPDTMDDVNGNPTEPDIQQQVRARSLHPRLHHAPPFVSF